VQEVLREDERRKFLQGLLALGGGAAILPELVEAAQSSVKLEKSLTAKILNRESVKNEPFTDHHFEMEITGANGVKQIVTSNMTEYKDALGSRRVWMTMQTDTFESAGAEKPIISDVVTMHSVSRKIDSSTEEITLTTVMNGKIYTNTMTAQIPAVRMTTEGLSDEEIIEKFFLSKVRGGAK
jgi:hypothetical protein